MDQSEQIKERLSSELSQKLLGCYHMISSESQPESLLTSLLLSNNSYYWAMNTSNDINGLKGRGRVTYDSEKAGLMNYDIDDDVDQDLDDQVNALLISALNNFLSDKQVPTGGAQAKNRCINMVKALYIQIITRNQYSLINSLNTPEYMRPYIENIQSELDMSASDVFNEWICDMEELGNDHLVELVESIGPEFFGVSKTTKAENTYQKYFINVLPTIKNPEELYSRYLLRRNEYRGFTLNIQQSYICPLMELTVDQYNKVRKTLLNEFQLKYSEDINSQYIYKLIYGLD